MVAEKKAVTNFRKTKGGGRGGTRREDLGEDSAGNKYNLYFTQGQFSKQKKIIFYFPFFYTSAHLYFSTIFPLDESEEEDRAKLLTKEEEEVDVMHSWVEAGAFQLDQRRKLRGFWQR